MVIRDRSTDAMKNEDYRKRMQQAASSMVPCTNGLTFLLMDKKYRRLFYNKGSK